MTARALRAYCALCHGFVLSNGTWVVEGRGRTLILHAWKGDAVKVKCALLALTALLVFALSAGAAFELRTWATTAAAPADGGSHSTSTSFEMVSRLGGPFVGSAQSASFSLWGCSVTPVEGAFFATETEPLTVTLRWTVETLGGISGFNIYRANDEDGPYYRLNEDIDPAALSRSLRGHDRVARLSVLVRAQGVLDDGSEEIVGAPILLQTGGTLATRLYNASPNPFRDGTVIQLDVAPGVRGVSLRIYDIAGRVVRALDTDEVRSGRYQVTWDGTNDNGRRVASGVYFVSLEAAGVRETGRLVYLR